MEENSDSAKDYCFICNGDKPPVDFLDTLYTYHSNSKILDKISKLMGKKFAVVFTNTDILCNACFQYFNKIDELELQIEYYSNLLIQNILDKYNLESGETSSSSTNYQCLQCGIFLGANYASLLEHIQEHTKFECSLCNHQFSEYFKLKLHKCNVLSNTSEQLKNIEETTELKSELSIFTKPKSSKINNHLKTIYSCQICNYETDIDFDMKLHINLHTKYDYKCDRCEASFRSPHNLELHQNRHVSGSRPIKCNICQFECVDKLHLRMHKKHTHQLHRTCGVCQYVGKSYMDLKEHQKSHANRLKLKCEICKRIFHREILFENHKEYAHRADAKCKFCGKEFALERELRLHENRHTRSPKTLSCSYCSKLFRTRNGLKAHIAKHTGEYKYFCEVCGRGCMSLVVLKEHMGVHTKEERYVCDICGKKFCFNATYRIHRMWHDNPKPYSCSECGKKFAHTSVLAVHRRKAHTGERPYACDNCSMTFVQSTALKRHKLIHSGDRPYNCMWCNKGFNERNLWAKHLANFHEDYTGLATKQKCEYKMVIKPEPETATVPSEVMEPENVPQYIIIDNANLENMFLYELQSETQETQNEVQIQISESYQMVESVKVTKPEQRLLEGVDESNIIIKTDDGEMVIRNGQLVRLTDVM